MKYLITVIFLFTAPLHFKNNNFFKEKNPYLRRSSILLMRVCNKCLRSSVVATSLFLNICSWNLVLMEVGRLKLISSQEFSFGFTCRSKIRRSMVMDRSLGVLVLSGKLSCGCSSTSYHSIEFRWLLHFRSRSFSLGRTWRDRSWLQGEWISRIWKLKLYRQYAFYTGETSNCCFKYLTKCNSILEHMETHKISIKKRINTKLTFLPSFLSYKHPGNRASRMESAISETIKRTAIQ